jgi:hypothetical protein
VLAAAARTVDLWGTNSVFSLAFKLGNMLYFLNVCLHCNLGQTVSLSELLQRVFILFNGYFGGFFVFSFASSVQFLWEIYTFSLYLLTVVSSLCVLPVLGNTVWVEISHVRNNCPWREVHDSNSWNVTTSGLSSWSSESLPGLDWKHNFSEITGCPYGKMSMKFSQHIPGSISQLTK